MRQTISNFQLMFLTANFIFSSAIINIPQIIVQIAGHNALFVPVITFPLVLVLILFLFKGFNKGKPLKSLFLIGGKENKGFVIAFLLLAATAFLRDVRGLIDFIASVLLPATPLDVLMVISICVIFYMAVSGLEVVSRLNTMHFVILTLMIIFLPLLLWNKVSLGNLQPFPTLHMVSSIMKAVYLSYAWMGEFIFFFMIISNVRPIKGTRKAVLFGAGLGLFLFSIILFLEISVLGATIIQEAAYPTYVLIQQINITDFFERIDLLIAAVWIPTIMAKLAFLLFGINHCLSYFYKSNTAKFLFPVSLILGLLSLLLFKNTMDYRHFSFYTWGTLGLLLEVITIVLFVMAKKKAEMKIVEKTPSKPIN